MNIRLLALTVLLVIAVRPAGLGQEAAKDSPPTAAAKQIIQELVAGQFEKVEALYDARMVQALPPGKLADGWRDLNKQAGAFQEITSTETSQVQGLQVVQMKCKFENSVLDATVVFNADGKLGGLSFRPHQAPAAPWTPPAYAKQNLFSEQPLAGERKIRIARDAYCSHGERAISSRGAGARFRPAGSRRNIGPNKPFKDLAWGLASRGIAGVPLYQAHAKIWRAKQRRS